MGAALEHVNITVSDPARTAAMLCDVFGWTVRWSGPAKSGGRTFHVGDADTYLAVYTPPPGAQLGAADSALHGGLNHVGVLVDDLDAVEMRVRDAGLTPFNHGDYAPGRRFYFLDHDGVEFEVVSYAA
ncbi:MAG: VOC family protein [Hyphomonadaceae bacterium]|nr:VOC family protein [Hyphomonadaceae bacterium]